MSIEYKAAVNFNVLMSVLRDRCYLYDQMCALGGGGGDEPEIYITNNPNAPGTGSLLDRNFVYNFCFAGIGRLRPTCRFWPWGKEDFCLQAPQKSKSGTHTIHTIHSATHIYTLLYTDILYCFQFVDTKASITCFLFLCACVLF
jgi:hypothetical protein